MKWHPIKSAPRDGTKIRLCVEGYEELVGWWNKRKWWQKGRWESEMMDALIFSTPKGKVLQCETEYNPTQWQELEQGRKCL